jgi:hypothetical protein
MLTYQSQLAQEPAPFSSGSANRALAGRSPFRGYGINHADNMRGLGREALIGVEQTGSSANRDYLQKYAAAQRQLSLGGLQNMNNEQQNASSLQSGILNGLIAGLFS